MSLLLGDCIERMAELPACSVAAVVTDPPYGLGFMGKTWDSPGGTGDHPMRRSDALNTVNTGVTRQGGRQRTCEDFTRRQLRDARSYQEWCEEWSSACLRVLRPGGFILAFGGTRTYHRLACAVEEAGFEIRDTIAWLYGTGYPKHPTLLKPALEPLVVARKTGAGSLNPKSCKIAWLSEADERASKDRNRHADYGSGPRENSLLTKWQAKRYGYKMLAKGGETGVEITSADGKRTFSGSATCSPDDAYCRAEGRAIALDRAVAALDAENFPTMEQLVAGGYPDGFSSAAGAQS